MATEVFISWSGDLSGKLGEALRDWLPGVLQVVRPYFSPEDTTKGSLWNSEISKELDDSNIGLICLTRDNIERPWLLFEAGALSKPLQFAHVCTILFNLEPSDIAGPLASFQHTKFSKEEFRRLVTCINEAGNDTMLPPKTLESVFEKWWPELEPKVKQILESESGGDKKQLRSTRALLEEILELSRVAASRRSGFRPVFPKALIDICKVVEDISDNYGRSCPAIIEEMIDRLDGPLKYIARRIGSVGIYTDHQHRMLDILERYADEPEDSGANISDNID